VKKWGDSIVQLRWYTMSQSQGVGSIAEYYIGIYNFI